MAGFTALILAVALQKFYTPTPTTNKGTL